MSEYQYHEWQSIDRLLTPAEQAAVNQLSSHMEVSPGKAVVTYNWSDFGHDPRKVLLKYFDAYYYMANWGSMRLMFRFPKGVLDENQIAPYRVEEVISFETAGVYQVVDLDFNTEDSVWTEETSLTLSDFIPLRAALLQGDYRLLYLGWLKEMTLYGEPDMDKDENSLAQEIEPPVPPGLKKLTPALESFIRAFDIDPFLVQAAAEASAELQATPSVNYRELAARLSRAECDDFLARLANGDAAVGMALRKRLEEFVPPSQPVQNTGKRRLAELIERSHQIKKEHELRKAEEDRIRHVAEMKALAKREPQAWQDIDRLLETGQKTAAVYDQATALLEKLKQLAAFQDTPGLFSNRVRQLAEKYSARPSLLKRWREKRWIS